MRGKKKYIIVVVLIIALVILAYIIKLAFLDNKDELSEKGKAVQEQILDFDQLEEEANDIKQDVQQDAVDFSDVIPDGEINNGNDAIELDNKENEKKEENINYADKNTEDLSEDKSNDVDEENLKAVQDTSIEYGPIN